MKPPFVMTAKRKECFEHLNIKNYHDLINHIPYRYDTFNDVNLNSELHDSVVCFAGRVISISKIIQLRGNLNLFHIQIEKNNMKIKVSVFNRLFLHSLIRENNLIVVKGRFDYYKKELTLSELFLSTEIINKVRPIYSLTRNMRDNDFSKLIKLTLEYLITNGQLEEIIPIEFIKQYKLIDRQSAYKFIHFPNNMEEIKQALRYLKYEELLMFSLKVNFDHSLLMSLEKKKNKKIDERKIEDLVKSLPYTLTQDQTNALREIVSDINNPNVMYRLLQGDVGTGKTVIAALTMIGVALNGYQSVLMVPTEILARQHYQSIKKLCPESIEVVLLVSDLSSKERKNTLTSIESGSAKIIVGTQAVIQEKVNYHNLGYIIIDEQHRFGVAQRQTLKLKGDSVDFLAMTATPIPRTLAISIYGEMDISIIKQFPNKIRNVMTKVLITNTIKSLLSEINTVIKAGKKIYIVCSLIEGDNEIKRNVNDVYEGLQNYFGNHFKIGLLHGKLNDTEKLLELEKFYRGETEILVSTTVIEVGVDIKEATMMIIYDAENFGLAQLHQLRGRIGRGGDLAKCYLLTTKSDDETLKRLRFMEQCNDGFELARFDLSLRGPGELIGMKQSGLSNFTFSSFVDDIKILDVAQKDAKKIIFNQSNLEYQRILRKINKDEDRKTVLI